jgi:hypothetical protein
VHLTPKVGPLGHFEFAVRLCLFEMLKAINVKKNQQANGNLSLSVSLS